MEELINDTITTSIVHVHQQNFKTTTAESDTKNQIFTAPGWGKKSTFNLKNLTSNYLVQLFHIILIAKVGIGTKHHQDLNCLL